MSAISSGAPGPAALELDRYIIGINIVDDGFLPYIQKQWCIEYTAGAVVISDSQRS